MVDFNGNMTKEELTLLLKHALQIEKSENFKVKFVGAPNNCDGHIGDLSFVNISDSDSNGNLREFDLVVKKGPADQEVRKVFPIRIAFETEIFIYSKVLPVFKNFQKKKLMRRVFDSYPRCYSTIIDENREVVILQNLKTLGYTLHNRYKPMDMNHLELVLKEYGRLHALSFALKDQLPEVFKNITNRKGDAMAEFINSRGTMKNLIDAYERVPEILKEGGRPDLQNLLDKLDINIEDSLREIIRVNEPQSVILHGDCWNNNFLFKYQDGEDRMNPTKVSLIDWQLSRIGTPVFDLSFFLYTTCSEQELQQFEILLECYYSSMSTFLRELGSDPDTIFTYQHLKEHWRKYSIYGFLLAPFSLKVTLNENTDFSVEDMSNGNSMSSILTKTELYTERIVAIVKHYLGTI